MSEEKEASINKLWGRVDTEGNISTDLCAPEFIGYVPRSPLMNIETFQKLLTAYIVEFWNRP